jgi:hypothetical protein
MHIFDQVDPLALDTRERHLWLLALTILSILAVGIALIIYPSVFSIPIALTVASPRATFFGLCGLAVLVVSYFVDRQLVISRLRRKTAGE